MLPHPVHSCIIIQIIEMQVCTIIVLLVMHIVTFLYDERLDVVTLKGVK